MHEPPRFLVPAMIAAYLGTSLSACAGATNVKKTTAKENTPMSMEAQSATGGKTALSAETILAQLLKLLDKSGSAKDFTPEKINAVFGKPLGFDGDRFGFGGPLAPAWRYGLNVAPNAMNGPVLMLNFDPAVSSEDPDATPVCKTDFEEFSASLTRIGFSREARYGGHGQITSFEFSRSGLWAVVDVQGEANDSPEKVRHLCVKAITIR